MILNYKNLSQSGRSQLSGAPEGLIGVVLADLVRTAECGLHIHVARDDRRLATLRDCLAVIDPELELLEFPAWDCLPYDRVSPNADVIGRRLHVLGSLARRGAGQENRRKTLIITTMNAVLQRVPPQSFFDGARFRIGPGEEIDLEELSAFLVRNGYLRTGTVREPGEYAFRGGIIDIFYERVGHEHNKVRAHIETIADTLIEIFQRADQQDRPTGEIADELAEERFMK